MEAKIFINGVIGEDTTLLDVIRQFKSFDNPTSVLVEISSPGGEVYEGQSIYSYLRNLNIPVTTYAKTAMSIAATIFMAGDTRKMDENGSFMIHMPSATVSGGSEVLEDLLKELKGLEKEFADFYSKYTNIDSDSVRRLLQNETFLDAEQAVEMGFATEIAVALKAVAFYDMSEDNTNLNKNEMTKIDKILNILGKAFSNEAENEITALVLQDANGTEINFPDLAEGEMPQIGDSAEVDGSPAEGEYVSPEGETWVFVGGALDSIIPSEDASEDAPVDAENEEDVNASNEEELSQEELVALEAQIQEMLEAFELKLTNKFTAQLLEENTSLKNEIKEIKKLMGTEDVSIEAQNQNNKKKSSGNYLTGVFRN